MNIDKNSNLSNMRFVKKEWMLGPTKTSVSRTGNSKYWKLVAQKFGITVKEARRQLCANCEYFDNSPDMLKDMEVIPNGVFDLDGGGRGWCKKFEFICHNLRTCVGGDWEDGR